MKYKKHKRRETAEKGGKHQRLTVPTCKLEMPDAIPGYPGEHFQSSDSAYESSTDCGSDGMTSHSGRLSRCGQYQHCYPHLYKSVGSTELPQNTISLSEQHLVSKNHSDYLTVPNFGPKQQQKVSFAAHQSSACHTNHHRNLEQRSFMYSEELPSLKIPPLQMRNHSTFSHNVGQLSPLSVLQSSSHFHTASPSYSQHLPSSPSLQMSPGSLKHHHQMSPGSLRKPHSCDITLPHHCCNSDGLKLQFNPPNEEQNPLSLAKMKTEENRHGQELSQSMPSPQAHYRNRASGEPSEYHQMYIKKSQVKQEMLDCMDDDSKHQTGRNNESYHHISPVESYGPSKSSLNPFTLTPSPKMSFTDPNSESSFQLQSNATRLSPKPQNTQSKFSSSNQTSTQTFKLPPTQQQQQQQELSKSRSTQDDLKNSCHSQLSALPFYASPSSLISDLAKNDCLLSIAEDYQIEQFTGTEETVAQALCQVGDSIVMRFVQWMKQLPFYR